MKNVAWVGLCPICSQGRQIISRENATGKLFILCQECDAEWQSPDDLRDSTKSSRYTLGPSTFVTLDRSQVIPGPIL